MCGIDALVQKDHSMGTWSILGRQVKGLMLLSYNYEHRPVAIVCTPSLERPTCI